MSNSAKRLSGETLKGAVVVVTGAGSGIGAATAVAFAQAGARVICVDIDAVGATQTAARCTEAGSPAAHAPCDVADWDAMTALAAQVAAEHGVPDVVVNNAGVGMSGRFNDIGIEDWRWIRSINLDGVVHGCRAFGPAMVERGSGQVVNVSSGLGYTPTATEPAYVTTKAAVLALSQCLRADWAVSGVGVSAICPGVINTPIVRSTRYLGDQASPAMRARTQRVFRRGHKPETVAKAIVDATRRDRAVVPVGWESSLAWFAHRLTPVALQQVVARRQH